MGEKLKEHDFASAWYFSKQDYFNEEEWSNFLSETFADATRFYIYKWFEQTIPSMDRPTFAEAGFGQCMDFFRCFKSLHDKGLINYAGFDITERFVHFARNKFAGYRFERENFFDPQYTEPFDVVYTRHVLEHQPPNVSYAAFEHLLNRTKKICFISWFVSPGIEETFQWIPSGDDVGAYVNRLAENKVQSIIKKLNFELEMPDPNMYVIKRKSI